MEWKIAFLVQLSYYLILIGLNQVRVTNHIMLFAFSSMLLAAWQILQQANAKEKTLKIKQKHGNPVSLISLFTDANFIYGQNDARKFGSKLDKIAKNTKLYESAALSGNGSSPNFALLSQLEHGYIDYTIDYPYVADYYNQQNQQNIQKLTIVNPAQNVVFGAIGCSTNAPNNYAEKVLAEINEALKNKVLPSERYQQSQRVWLKQSFPEFSSYYQRYILDPLKEPAIDELTTPADHP